jgi:hypothetical protein
MTPGMNLHAYGVAADLWLIFGEPDRDLGRPFELMRITLRQTDNG